MFYNLNNLANRAEAKLKWQYFIFACNLMALTFEIQVLTDKKIPFYLCK